MKTSAPLKTRFTAPKRNDECDDDCCCCDDDEDVYEVKCPNCDEEICIDGPYWIKVKFSARTAARP